MAASEARAAYPEAKVSDAEAEIACLKLMIEKLRRELFGQRLERKERLLDQLELPRQHMSPQAESLRRPAVPEAHIAVLGIALLPIRLAFADSLKDDQPVMRATVSVTGYRDDWGNAHGITKYFCSRKWS